MSKRIPVRESFQACQWILVVMTLCLTIVAANAVRNNSAFTWWIASAVAASWLAYEATVAFRKLSVPYVVIHGDAFDYVENLQTTFVPDYSVSAIAVATRQQYFLGTLQAIHRRYTIWSDLDANPINLESKATVSNPDPLDPLIARLKDRVLQRAREELLSGRVVEGDSWSLNARHLRWDSEGRSHVIGPDQLAACEEFDHHICIWREGQAAPIIKFPESGRNATLLHELLQPGEVSETAPASNAPATMGRLLFERRIDTGGKLYYITAAAFIVSFGAYLHVEIVNNPVAWRTATALMLTSLPVLFIGYRSANAAYRYYEGGVKYVGLLGSRTYLYADVARMRYRVTRQFHKGIYCGIEVDLQLIPKRTPGARALQHRMTVLKHDESMDHVAIRISKVIAARIAYELEEGRSVQWTDDATLEPYGLRFKSKDLCGPADSQRIPYREIGRMTVQDDTLSLFHQDELKPFLQVSSSATNFNAVIRVLDKLRNAQTQELQGEPNGDFTTNPSIAGAA